MQEQTELELQMESELVAHFRQCTLEFKEIALISLKGQAERCVARKPRLTLRLVSPVSPVTLGDGLRTVSGGT